MPIDDLERKIQMVMAQTQVLQQQRHREDSSPVAVHPITRSAPSAAVAKTSSPPALVEKTPPPPAVAEKPSTPPAVVEKALPPPPPVVEKKERPSSAGRRKAPMDTSTRLYERAAEMREKLEAKRRERPKGCTFSPATSTAPRPSSRKAERKSRRVPVEESAPTYSFKPAITEKGRMSSSSPLYAQARTVKEKLERERAAPPKGCTFKPEISPRARSASPVGRRKPIYERLHDSAGETAAKRAEEAERRRKAEEEEYSRHTPPTKRADGKSMAQRSAEYLSEKEKKLARLREAREQLAAAEATFAPRVNHHRTPPRDDDACSATSSSVGSAVHDRLYRSSQTLAAKERELRRARDQRELAECSFQPELPAAARRHSSSSSSRLLDDTRDVAAIRDELKRARELEGCTFTPAVGRSPVGGREKKTPAYERLARCDTAGKAAERGRLRAERETQGCTFRPRTGRSPARNASKPVFDRMKDDENARRARSVERARRREDEERQTLEKKNRIAKRSPSAERIQRLATPRRSSGERNRRSPSPQPSTPHRRTSTIGRKPPTPQAAATSSRQQRSTPGSIDEIQTARSQRPPISPRVPSTPPQPSPSLHVAEPENVSPSVEKDFERWQKEMEAKLASL